MYDQGDLQIALPKLDGEKEKSYLNPDYVRRPYDIPKSEFGVFLPHSCDEWVVAAGTVDEVVAGLNALISDARTAIEKLRGLEK